jgi:hypothetical protein
MAKNANITVKDVMGKWDYFPADEIYNISDEEAEQEISRIMNTIKALANQNSITEMFKLVYLFRDGANVWDVDEVYMHAIEKMPSYPPVELFTDTTTNNMISHLRRRYWNHQTIPYDESIATFYELATQLFAKKDFYGKSVPRWLSSELIGKMSNHEVRLTLEIIHHFSLDVYFVYFDYLISRLDK